MAGQQSLPPRLLLGLLRGGSFCRLLLRRQLSTNGDGVIFCRSQDRLAVGSGHTDPAELAAHAYCSRLASAMLQSGDNIARVHNLFGILAG